MKGLMLSVYKSARIGDCTNDGATSVADAVVVVGYLKDGKVEPLPKECQVFPPVCPESPAMVLVHSRAPGYDPTPHLVPLDLIDNIPADSVGPMFGGNYAGSSDGRWSALGKLFGVPALGPVAVHDRVSPPPSSSPSWTGWTWPSPR